MAAENMIVGGLHRGMSGSLEGGRGRVRRVDRWIGQGDGGSNQVYENRRRLLGLRIGQGMQRTDAVATGKGQSAGVASNIHAISQLRSLDFQL